MPNTDHKGLGQFVLLEGLAKLFITIFAMVLLINELENDTIGTNPSKTKKTMAIRLHRIVSVNKVPKAY
ncbi:hypothetical protein Goklo_023607 [Gossypium klotzschianum]|uniref:Uncharacterized protein n=1 Tax=Gossypium klotzschianum TaxID=34286 RepID=A0A7J8TR42_9ROSI|nr:hypothetical protein [Gossypium klotzschianum]